MEEKRPLCPFLSTAQIVPFGVQLQGSAQEQGQLSLQDLKVGSLGGHGASTRKATVVGLQGGFSYKTKRKDGTEPKPTDPPDELKFIGESVAVPCIGPSCKRWCPDHEDCKIGCSSCAASAYKAVLEELKASLAGCACSQEGKAQESSSDDEDAAVEVQEG